MKRALLLVFMIGFFGIDAICQNAVLPAVNGFNDLAESFSKLVSSFKSIDDNTNKERAVKMKVVLLSDVNNLIEIKTTILEKLPNPANDNIGYKSEINTLADRLSKLQDDLSKYKDLALAAGVNTQMLIDEIKLDYTKKMTQLNTASLVFYKSGSLNNSRSTLLGYFENCIKILKRAQKILLTP